MADDQRRRTALIVDDEAPLLGLLDEVLREEGFATTCCERGQAALAALRQERYDLLLLDVGLPDMNGLRIALAARERYDDEPVILVMTGADRQTRKIGAYALGADDFLSKPFAIEDLIARIQAKF